MNYLYFAEGATVNATGEAMMLPANRFIGADSVSATTTLIRFSDFDNVANQTQAVVTHASGKHKEVIELLASILKPSPGNRGKFIVVADEENNIYLDNGNGAGLNGVVELTV
jgi:hypothetical protein